MTTCVVCSTDDSGRTTCVDSGGWGGVGAVRISGAAVVSVELLALLIVGDLGIMMWVMQDALTDGDIV